MPLFTVFNSTVARLGVGVLVAVSLSACGSTSQTTPDGRTFASTENVYGDVIGIDEYGTRSLVSMAKSDLDEDLLSRDMTADEIQMEHYKLLQNAKIHKDAVLVDYKTECMVANSGELRPDFEHPHRELVSGADEQDSPSVAFASIVSEVSDIPPGSDVNVVNDNPAFEFSATRPEKAVVDAANAAHSSGDETDFTWKCQLVRDINEVTS